MTLHPLRRPAPSEPVADMSVTDLISRAVAGLSDGMMPGARLEALIAYMETRR